MATRLSALKADPTESNGPPCRIRRADKPLYHERKGTPMNDLFLDYKTLFPKLDLLCQNFESIRREYFELGESLEFKDFTKQQDSYILKNRKGYPITVSSYFEAGNMNGTAKGWHVAAMAVNNELYLRNSQFCPTLSGVIRTLNQHGNVLVCAFNILDADVSLDWHNDDEYSGSRKSFRSLWVIDSPESDCIFQMKCANTGRIETRQFRNNSIYSFLHHTTHRVENKSSKPRIALAIDIVP